MPDENELPDQGLSLPPAGEVAEDQHPTKLNAAERQLCQGAVIYGVEWLLTQPGYELLTSVRAFLNRREVIRQIAYFQKQYADRSAISERVQFFGMLQLNALVPAAINIVARSLVGVKVNPQSGAIDSRPPDRGQFDAAVEVLGRCNVQGSKYAGNSNLPSIDAGQMEQLTGETVRSINGLTKKGRIKITRLLNDVIAGLDARAAAEERLAARAAGEPLVPEVMDDDDQVPPSATPAKVTAPKARPAARPRRPADPRDG